MSTVEVSEYGLPVDCVSMMASCCVLERRISAALRRMRERSMGGVCDQDGNALVPAWTAASSVDWDDVYILATGCKVDGSIASMTLVLDAA